jgi:hypothetical protein
MSKKIPSQDFNYKFEHHWGGEDTWFTKGKRWANKQKFPINHLALGFLVWLHERWVDGRVEMEMASIDKQVKYIGEIWDKEDEQRKPEVVETGVFGDEEWSISITNPVVVRGTEESNSGVGIGSDEVRLQKEIQKRMIFEGDWNDWSNYKEDNL